MSASASSQPVSFHPGDVVQLKTGGPMMTVHKTTQEICTCVWFTKEDYTVMREAKIAHEALVPASPS